MIAKVIRGPWPRRPVGEFVPRGEDEMRTLLDALELLRSAVRVAELRTLQAITINFPAEAKPTRRRRTKPKSDDGPPAA